MLMWFCDRCGVDATDGRAEVNVQVVDPDPVGEDPGPAHLDGQNARLFQAVQNLAGRANRGAIQQHKAQ